MSFDLGHTRFTLERAGEFWALSLIDLARDEAYGQVLLTHQQLIDLAHAVSARQQFTAEGAQGGYVQTFTWDSLNFFPPAEPGVGLALNIHAGWNASDARNAIACVLRAGTRKKGRCV